MLGRLFRKGPPPETPKTIEERVDEILTEAGEGFLDVGYRSRQFRTGIQRTIHTAPEGEFFQAEEFVPGEHDPRSIMARATMAVADENMIFRRVCRPDAQTTVHVLADVNRTLDFGHSRESKLKLMGRCMATVALSLKDSGDLMKVAMYANDQIVYRSYRAMFPGMIMRTLIEMILDPVGSTGELSSGLEDALTIVPSRGQSEIVLLSDFINITKEQRELLRMVASVNNLRCIVLQDLRERELPAGGLLPAPLKAFDVNTGKQVTWWLTRSERERYAREFKEHDENLRKFFDDNGISFEVVDTNEGPASIAKVIGLLASPPLFS